MQRSVRLAIAWLTACVFAVLLPDLARAQTCIAPQPLQLSPDNPFFVGGNTCGGEPAGRVLCNGNVVTTAPSQIFSLIVGAGNDATLTVNGAGFAPIMYLTGGNGACDSGACLGGSGFLSLHDVAPGEHWLVVMQGPLDAVAACGTFTLSLGGSLAGPDVIIDNGFD
jgi:hypothetical protein